MYLCIYVSMYLCIYVSMYSGIVLPVHQDQWYRLEELWAYSYFYTLIGTQIFLIIIIIIRSTHVHCAIHDREADLPFFFVSNIVGTDKFSALSGATLRIMHLRYLPNSSSFMYGTSHREAVSTILKVFGMTRFWVG